MGALKGGLGYLSRIAYNCHHFATKNFLYKRAQKGHKCAQLQTVVHKLQRVALSPHLRAPFGLSPN